jgi:hypothetical protein
MLNLTEEQIDKALEEIKDQANEYAWIFNQGEKGPEDYEIARSSFIAGAEILIQHLKGELFID